MLLVFILQPGQDRPRSQGTLDLKVNQFTLSRMKIIRTTVGLFRHDDDGKCQTCGLFDGHGNTCIDGAPYRLIAELREDLDYALKVAERLRYACFEGRPIDLLKNVAEASAMADEALNRAKTREEVKA